MFPYHNVLDWYDERFWWKRCENLLDRWIFIVYTEKCDIGSVEVSFDIYTEILIFVQSCTQYLFDTYNSIITKIIIMIVIKSRKGMEATIGETVAFIKVVVRKNQVVWPVLKLFPVIEILLRALLFRSQSFVLLLSLLFCVCTFLPLSFFNIWGGKTQILKVIYWFLYFNFYLMWQTMQQLLGVIFVFPMWDQQFYSIFVVFFVFPSKGGIIYLG